MGAAAFWLHHHRLGELDRAHREYARQLEGRLTEKERQLEALNTRLGTAQSQLERQSDLENQYKAQLTEKDAAFESFRKQHDLVVRSMSDSLSSLHEQVHGGREQVRVVETPPTPGGTAPAQPVISYEYVDPNGRFHLSDPNIWKEGDELLEIQQLFRMRGQVFQQKDGALQTERVQLFEVVKKEDGSYQELAEASLVDSHFSYNTPPPPAPSEQPWAVKPLLTLGAWLPRQRDESLPVRLGAAAQVLRLGPFGLAAGLSYEIAPEPALGPDVLVTFRPSPRLNVSVGAGVHLPLWGRDQLQFAPTVNACFHLY
ncbi:hypothetical protein DAT35_09500 [Vitiosangium sp. GDMCC 1.1324]|nr:hypothetical protein DAT35_09500 [Vitiosangium sp. GDMCC 1.1324]